MGGAPDALQALDAGREALDRGEHAAAAVRLGVALRLGPAFAPAILDALGDVHQPELELVRGDAYRLVGREVEARRSYAAVLRQLAATSATSGPPGADAEPRTARQAAPSAPVDDEEPVLPSSVVPAHAAPATPDGPDAAAARPATPKADKPKPTPPKSGARD